MKATVDSSAARIVKWLLTVSLLSALPLFLSAQTKRFLPGGCLAPKAVELTPGSVELSPTAGGPLRLPDLRTQWDSARVYPVMVVLVEFTDCTFSTPSPAERYDSLFNLAGYNGGRGAGCVADYFRQQSGGLFHPRFDIYGPVRVATAARDNGTYGGSTFRSAVKLLTDSLGSDLSIYDWDGNGFAESVVVVYAGYGANESAEVCEGCIWPNTGSFSTITAPTARFQGYSASQEHWSDGSLCGVGTICHEFSHTLGLPDLYPLNSGGSYSVVDEWDLMDGGNFSNSGWCPPNYSALEKMLLGWLQPQVLDAPATIEALRPLAEGGQCYRVNVDGGDATEYFLLENRQWTGWDRCLPGRGLVVSHVHYSAAAWSGNLVNSVAGRYRYDLVHADNLDYDAWDALVGPGVNPYQSGHSRILSGTAYPWLVDGRVQNDSLTDNSQPAAVTFTGSGLLGKPITAITMDADGNVAFRFMGSATGLSVPMLSPAGGRPAVDLLGRPSTGRRGIVVVDGRKVALP